MISPNDKEIVYLFQQWKDKAANLYVDNDKLSMVIRGERIYIDYLENGSKEYEVDELVGVDISIPFFYSICYSDRDIMKFFIQNSIFSEGSFIDNDLGRIVLINELRKEEILDFIQ